MEVRCLHHHRNRAHQSWLSIHRTFPAANAIRRLCRRRKRERVALVRGCNFRAVLDEVLSGEAQQGRRTLQGSRILSLERNKLVEREATAAPASGSIRNEEDEAKSK